MSSPARARPGPTRGPLLACLQAEFVQVVVRHATESGSASPLLALALGVLALAGVAGARAVTGRVS